MGDGSTKSKPEPINLSLNKRVSPTEPRWRLDPAAGAAARDLTDRENACCSFFTFAFRPGEDGPWLTVRVPATRVAVLDALDDRAAAGMRS